MDISQLSGSLNEQAKQLLDILKTQQLSVEELDKLVPMGTDFVKEFCSVLREQVLSEKESQGQIHRPERVNQGTCPYDPQ